MKTNFIRLIFLYFLFLAVACGKTTEKSPADDPLADSISLATFMSVPPPTFQQIKKAYNDIIAENPTITQTALTRELFLWVRAHPDGSMADLRESPIEQTVKQLTIEEWKILFWVDIYELNGLINSRDMAYEAVNSEFPCDVEDDFDDSKANAILHAYWNAMMVRHASPELAEEFATAHESASAPTAFNTVMDLHNNRFGRDFAEKYPEATDKELLQLLIRQKFVYFDSIESLAGNKDALVYFTAKRPYDGTYTGQLSNPDSGGPWNVSFSFSQCGKVLRGMFTLVRGQEKQGRRFTGTLNNEGTISLTVSDPYLFENPNHLSYCTNMNIALKDNGSGSLTGNWTSSNCSLGGTVSLSK